MRIDEDGCTRCQKCHKLCEVGLKPEAQLNAPECIRCLECVKCPPKAISAETVFDPDPESQSQTEKPDSANPNT
jgi:ferredoxin